VDADKLHMQGVGVDLPPQQCLLHRAVRQLRNVHDDERPVGLEAGAWMEQYACVALGLSEPCWSSVKAGSRA
jgi:hypothetical protein